MTNTPCDPPPQGPGDPAGPQGPEGSQGPADPSPVYLAALTLVRDTAHTIRTQEAVYYRALHEAASHAPGSGSLSVRAFRAEIAALLRMNEYQVDADLSLAYTLGTEFPLMLDALRDGRISVQHARKLVQVAAPLGNVTLRVPKPGSLPEHLALELLRAQGREAEVLIRVRRAQFAEVMLEHARTRTPAQLVPIGRKLVELWTVDSLAERHQRAVSLRNVRVYDCDDGMADLVAHVPAVEAYAMKDRVLRVARLLPVEDVRSRDERCADAFVALTLGCPLPGAGGEPVAGVGALLLPQTEPAEQAEQSEPVEPVEPVEMAVEAERTEPAEAAEPAGQAELASTGGRNDIGSGSDGVAFPPLQAELQQAADAALERAFAVKGQVQLVVRVDALDAFLTTPPESPPESPPETQTESPPGSPVESPLGCPAASPAGSQLDRPPVNSRSHIEHSAPVRGSPLLMHAELAGYGPVTIDAVIPFLRGTSSWGIMGVHPGTGAVLTTDTYRPSAHIKRLLEARDPVCRFPGCRAPVLRNDFDHTVPAAVGGDTSTENLKGLCRGHHTMKHHGGWSDTQLAGGIVEWVSPAGHAYTEMPEDRIIEDHVPEHLLPDHDGVRTAQARLHGLIGLWRTRCGVPESGDDRARNAGQESGRGGRNDASGTGDARNKVRAERNSAGREAREVRGRAALRVWELARRRKQQQADVQRDTGTQRVGAERRGSGVSKASGISGVSGERQMPRGPSGRVRFKPSPEGDSNGAGGPGNAGGAAGAGGAGGADGGRAARGRCIDDYDDDNHPF